MRDVLLVGAGGFLGAIARYLLGIAVTSRLGTAFPVHTFVINVTGSLILGGIMGAAEVRELAPWIRPLCAAGFLGAYTTFSTFTWETTTLAARGDSLTAIVYLGLSLLCGLGASVAGLAFGRTF
jgi:CrcB protein